MTNIESSVIARFKREGKTFEILVDCDKAIEYREGKIKNISEVLVTDDVFSDVKQAEHSPEKEMQAIFKTTDKNAIIERIVKEGEIQLTTEHKQKLQDEKKKRIVDIIHKNTVDSKTGFPHPAARIEMAMKEARVNINATKTAEGQVEDVIKQLREILPIKYEKRELSIKIRPEHVGKTYGTLKMFGKLIKENYENDGSLKVSLEIPAGMQEDLLDALNKATHGQVVVDIVRKF